jgi:transposase InsO family protein
MVHHYRVKKVVSPRARRSVVERIMTERALSQRHAFRSVDMQRSSARFQCRTGPDEAATLYITLGSPWENPFTEGFNGTFRGECLDRRVFADAHEAQIVIEQWRQAYTHRRPPSSLGYLPPVVFAD